MTTPDPFCIARVKNPKLDESEEQYQKTEVTKKTLGKYFFSKINFISVVI